MKIKWGAYMGALILGFFSYSVSSLCKIAGECIFYKQAILILIGAGIGFLIGWRLHSSILYIIRLFKKK
jgi:hypothetical protein